MKKTLLHLIILLCTALVVMTACTRNNGDIGPWFGTWHVEQIVADGNAVDTPGDYFFQFQNKVVRVSLVSEHEQWVESYGTWEEADGDRLLVSFPDSAVFYIVMPGLETGNDFAVTGASSRRATLSKVSSTGVKYTYSLRKKP